jgi:hypothetical protein
MKKVLDKPGGGVSYTLVELFRVSCFLPTRTRKEVLPPMNRIIFSCISMLLLCLSSAAGDGIPALALDAGENHIALALVNNSGSDIAAVSVSVDETALPKWLSVQCESGSVAIRKGARALDKLYLLCTVMDAPTGVEALVPITLRDASGKSWSYSITMRANASKPLPDALIGNSPNPFNPDTSIGFSLAENRRVSLVVYNALGQKVRTLVNGPLAAGKHMTRWDGRDDRGRNVSSGIYFCTMKTGTYTKSVKMLFAQ